MKYVIFTLVLLSWAQYAYSSEFIEVTKDDFDPVLEEAIWHSKDITPKIEYDFDRDGKMDRIVVEVNLEKTVYRVVAYLSSESGLPPKTLWSRAIPETGYRGVWEAIWLKPEGEKGASDQKYFNAPGKAYPYLSDFKKSDSREYEEAIFKYIGFAAIEASESAEPPIDAEDAFYCNQFYYFENGDFKKLSKCD